MKTVYALAACLLLAGASAACYRMATRPEPVAASCCCVVTGDCRCVAPCPCECQAR